MRRAARHPLARADGSADALNGRMRLFTCRMSGAGVGRIAAFTQGTARAHRCAS
jgi:hypothetical protein